MKPSFASVLVFSIFIIAGCRKDNQLVEKIPTVTVIHQPYFSIPCYHLSVVRPVAYIQGPDTVIYSYDGMGRLILAAKFNSNVANRYSYDSYGVVFMNQLPLGGNTYSPSEYRFYFNSDGAISSLLNEIGGYSAYFLYNHAGQLDSLVWSTPMVEYHGQYGIFDSTIYDSYGNLIAFSSTSVDVQTHYTYTMNDKQIMTYYPNQSYQEYDPEKRFNSGSNYYGLDPQMFSKDLIASQNDFNAPANYAHYYSYSRNDNGLINEVTDSSSTSVVKRYIYYDCQ